MLSPNFVPQRSDRWQSVYQGALSESEISVRLARISDARNAIFDRAEEILTHSSGEERRALSHALRTLKLLEDSIRREEKAA
jgi:hypothetical protein